LPFKSQAKKDFYFDRMGLVLRGWKAGMPGGWKAKKIEPISMFYD
jgi:hypothetical protein